MSYLLVIWVLLHGEAQGFDIKYVIFNMCVGDCMVSHNELTSKFVIFNI